MAYLTKHLRTIGKLILVIMCAPVVALIALAVGQLHALMVLLALPFILAFEVVDRKCRGSTAASPDPDELEKLYPDAPHQMLLGIRRESMTGVTANDGGPQDPREASTESGPMQNV
jgi:hypothetical protein